MRLNLQRKPEWFELIAGVRVLLKPATSAVFSSARMQFAAEDELPDLDVLATADPMDAALARDEVALKLAKAIARQCVVEWEGIVDDDDQPIPVSDEAIDALLDVFPVFEAFQVKFMAVWLGLQAEKNDSAPLPSGTSVGATVIAVPADGSVPNAQPD